MQTEEGKQKLLEKTEERKYGSILPNEEVERRFDVFLELYQERMEIEEPDRDKVLYIFKEVLHMGESLIEKKKEMRNQLLALMEAMGGRPIRVEIESLEHLEQLTEELILEIRDWIVWNKNFTVTNKDDAAIRSY